MVDSIRVLIDDRHFPAELRHDLDAYLRAQPQVERLGAFIPHMEGSAAVLGATAGILTTVYALVPNSLKESASELVKQWVTEWIKQKFKLGAAEAGESVTLVDQYGDPCVRVEIPPVRSSKLNRNGRHSG